jgi:hypothetical protein
VPVGDASQREALGAARARWAAVAPDAYTVVVGDGGPGSRTLAVRDGQVVSLGAAEPATVDDVFATIEESIEAGADVEVEYDPELGYPTSVVIELEGGAAPDVDLQLTDLEAMPIVETLDQLIAAQRRWEAAGVDAYRYLFRADCTCPDDGTFEVTVEHNRVAEVRPLDDAARDSSLSPGSLDEAFDDLELWFTDSAELIDEGILAVDVRMDPELGYPRWFRVEAKGLDGDAFEDEFTIVVTIDLLEVGAPSASVTSNGAQRDLADLAQASERWERAALTDFSYVVTVHCECPIEVAGPFDVTVVDGDTVSVVRRWDGEPADVGGIELEESFDVIEEAIASGTDVDVTYHPVLGYPELALIDPEAVAVDGGVAFGITEVAPIGGDGVVAGRVLAGPACDELGGTSPAVCVDDLVPNVPIFIGDPQGNGLVPVATAADGTFVLTLRPGDYVVTMQVTDGLGPPERAAVTVSAGEVVRVDLSYGT